MPTFRGSRSPSLRKMELNNGKFDNGKFGNGGSKGFSMSNVFGDPFSLATIGIAIVSARPRVLDRMGNMLTRHSVAG